jgi:hypothetical protein
MLKIRLGGDRRAEVHSPVATPFKLVFEVTNDRTNYRTMLSQVVQ